jgi:hypothetical protein
MGDRGEHLQKELEAALGRESLFVAVRVDPPAFNIL